MYFNDNGSIDNLQAIAYVYIGMYIYIPQHTIDITIYLW